VFINYYFLLIHYRLLFYLLLSSRWSFRLKAILLVVKILKRR